jgi:hypothetical protein
MKGEEMTWFSKVHPDLHPSPVHNAKQSACYNSWLSAVNTIRDHPEYIEITTEKASIKSVLVWETINKYGPNTTYTECDGIPRIRFLGATKTDKSLITVTLNAKAGPPKFIVKNTKVPAPTCTDLDAYLCRKLQGIDEVGGDDYGKYTIRPLEHPMFKSVCPIKFGCIPFLSEVVLLYWPEDVVSRDVCGSDGSGSSITRPWDGGNAPPVSFSTDAITFEGQDLYLRSVDGTTAMSVVPSGVNIHQILWPGGTYLDPFVMKGQWTFTSPTLYLAYRPVTQFLQLVFTPTSSWDYQSMQVPILTQSAGVIALRPNEVYTMRPDRFTKIGGLEYARAAANGSFRPVFDVGMLSEQQQAVPISIGDLLYPIPASLYYDMRVADCWGEQNYCGTITENIYRPRLSIAERAWKSIFGTSMCSDPLLGDPPISLRPIRGLSDLEPPELPKYFNPDVQNVQNPSFPFTRPGSGYDPVATGDVLNSDGVKNQPPSISDWFPKPGQAAEPNLPNATPTLVSRPRPQDLDQLFGQVSVFNRPWVVNYGNVSSTDNSFKGEGSTLTKPSSMVYFMWISSLLFAEYWV